MTREDVRKTFPEATDEQVNAIMSVHGADIEKTKASAGADAAKLAALQTDLSKAKETITALEKNKTDAEAITAEIEKYRAADAKRAQDEKAAQERAALEARFNAAVGERKFVHEFVRKGVLEEFGKALCDKANEGKGDAAIFDQLTRDKDYFASMNQPGKPDMGGAGPIGSDEDARAVMGLPVK